MDGRTIMRNLEQLQYHSSFYPTALKGCRGIAFTHGVRMGGWAGGRRVKFLRPVSQEL